MELGRKTLKGKKIGVLFGREQYHDERSKKMVD